MTNISMDKKRRGLKEKKATQTRNIG